MIDWETQALSGRSGHVRRLGLGLALAVLGLFPEIAQADRIKHPIAVFSGLDKITGRIIAFEVSTDETVQFGSLQITERACYTSPATETPQTTTFIEVDEVGAGDDYKRIFAGWMFAASPGLHGIEHPIYDIWLTGCKGGSETVATVPSEVQETLPVPEPKPPANKRARQRREQPEEDLPDDPFVEAPRSMPEPTEGPIEVGPPPGFIPNTPRQRRAPVQRYYPTEQDSRF
jgi:hypothetical protein